MPLSALATVLSIARNDRLTLRSSLMVPRSPGASSEDSQQLLSRLRREFTTLSQDILRSSLPTTAAAAALETPHPK